MKMKEKITNMQEYYYDFPDRLEDIVQRQSFLDVLKILFLVGKRDEIKKMIVFALSVPQEIIKRSRTGKDFSPEVFGISSESPRWMHDVYNSHHSVIRLDVVIDFKYFIRKIESQLPKEK